ncbi:hypothetical protein [Catellatospora sp. IY07-71]|uniref:DUF6999 family protein n=1 Tax=Catellatospora sp. IY07-71 TaxID=2728827 RepID=UPI001FD2F74C|nr:hypothetical protein [Catellatospora sp. IY07-71]
MRGPTVWTAVMADPTVPIAREVLAMVVADQRQWTRRWLYPPLRIVSRVAVWLIRVVKTLLPIRLSAHAVMDRLCVWFLRRFVSPRAGELLIRHFLIETDLLAFIARNSGVAGVPEPVLRPTTLAGLGDRAVIEHDVNVYDVLIALGAGRPGPRGPLDFSMLGLPAIDASPQVRRWLRLDIQTALCLMNIPFALCLTTEEYRRAVHSMRLDESLMTVLAELTGDDTFLRWRPGGVVVRVDSGLDVPRAVYEHAVVHEYAHARLVALAAGGAGQASSRTA